MARVAETLECPVCLRPLAHARVSACGHALCAGCEARIAATASTAAPPRCPVCRAAMRTSACYALDAAAEAALCDDAEQSAELRARRERTADLARKTPPDALAAMNAALRDMTSSRDDAVTLLRTQMGIMSESAAVALAARQEALEACNATVAALADTLTARTLLADRTRALAAAAAQMAATQCALQASLERAAHLEAQLAAAEAAVHLAGERTAAQVLLAAVLRVALNCGMARRLRALCSSRHMP